MMNEGTIGLFARGGAIARRESWDTEFGMSFCRTVRLLLPPEKAMLYQNGTPLLDMSQFCIVFIYTQPRTKKQLQSLLRKASGTNYLRFGRMPFSLKLGDSLRESIDRGRASSRNGVVVLSKFVFRKHWPAKELNGLATREINDKKVILPVWYEVTFEEVQNYSPTLADRIAVSTNQGLDQVVQGIVKVLEN